MRQQSFDDVYELFMDGVSSYSSNALLRTWQDTGKPVDNHLFPCPISVSPPSPSLLTIRPPRSLRRIIISLGSA